MEKNTYIPRDRYASSLLIKNNQEKHALNSKMIQKSKWKNEKKKKERKDNRWKNN